MPAFDPHGLFSGSLRRHPSECESEQEKTESQAGNNSPSRPAAFRDARPVASPVAGRAIRYLGQNVLALALAHHPPECALAFTRPPPRRRRIGRGDLGGAQRDNVTALEPASS